MLLSSTDIHKGAETQDAAYQHPAFIKFLLARFRMTYRIIGIHVHMQVCILLLCFRAISAAISSPSVTFSRQMHPWGVRENRGGEQHQQSSSPSLVLLSLRGGSEQGDTDKAGESTTTVDEVVVEGGEGGNSSATIDLNSLIFNVTQYGDGSESDPDGIPDRYLRMQKGNREKAKLAFDYTVQWREDHGINDILSRPYPTFDLCKRVFPVYIPGRDKEGNVVIVQRVGLIDFELGHAHNMTTDDILNYYLYLVEYCWNILEPKPNAVMTTLLDLKGVKISTFRDSEKRNFMKQFVTTMSDNYPNRSHKTIMINAPSWAQMAYKVCKPLLRESTKKKISMWNGGKAQDEILIEVLGKDAVPRELLEYPDDLDEVDGNGNSEEHGASEHQSSSIEKELRSFVSTNLFLPRAIL